MKEKRVRPPPRASLGIPGKELEGLPGHLSAVLREVKGYREQWLPSPTKGSI